MTKIATFVCENNDFLGSQYLSSFVDASYERENITASPPKRDHNIILLCIDTFNSHKGSYPSSTLSKRGS